MQLVAEFKTESEQESKATSEIYRANEIDRERKRTRK